MFRKADSNRLDAMSYVTLVRSCQRALKSPQFSDETEFRFRSSLVPGELAIGKLPVGYRVSVQDNAVREELVANFVPTKAGYSLGDSHIAANDTLALQVLAERIFQLSMSMPTRPLDVFRERIKRKPASPKTADLRRSALVVRRSVHLGPLFDIVSDKSALIDQ